MTRRLRIAMVAACPFPFPRGTPIRAFRMAEALARRGHELHVVTYHLGAAQVEAPFVIHRIPAVPTYRKVSPGPTYQKLLVVDSLLAVTLARVLRSVPVDVIHAHHYEGLLVAALVALVRRGASRPLVYDAHTMLDSELPSYRLALPGRVLRALGRWLDGVLPRAADRIVTVTEDIRAKLVRRTGVSPAAVTVVPSGVEWDRFAVASQVARRNGPESVVFAGNLASYQRIDLLLAAFRDVRQARPHVRLLIASESPFDPYERLARSLGVRDGIDVVAADVAVLPALLAGAAVAVNPRTACDGMPQKVLNYMAAGKAVVSFAGSGKALEHGRTGWLVPEESGAALARGLLHVLGEPALAERLGANARAHVAAHHSWEGAARAVEAVYEELLAAGATS